MAKVKFTTAVKYNGKFLPANEAFEVEDKDFESLVNSGAVVVEKPVEKAPEPDVVPEVVPEVVPDKVEDEIKKEEVKEEPKKEEPKAKSKK